LLALCGFVAAAAGKSFRGYVEAQSDVFGLEVIHGFVPNSGGVAAEAFELMGEVNLSDPNPPEFIRVWLYSHPPLAERLIFARTYGPWTKGQAPQFVK